MALSKALFKKNIWTLYTVIVCITFVIFSTFGIMKWAGNRDSFVAQQKMQVELFSSAVYSLLTSQEALLEVVGHQLVKQSDFTRTAAFQIRPILDKLLDTHPAIAAFGLLNPKGDYLAVSSNLKLADQSNLLELPYTRSSFLEAIDSPKMVLGRTYFHDSLNSLVIPIRKAISIGGQVEAVMTAGLRLDSTLVFRNDVHTGSYNTLALLRNDRYRQFYSSTSTIHDDVLKPIDPFIYQAVTENFVRQSEGAFEEAYTGYKSYTSIVDELPIHSLVTAKYLPNYQLWVVARTELDYINQRFINEFSFYSVFFILLHIGFYSLVRSVAKNEKNARNQLIYQANHDRLTSLPNRQYIRNHISEWLDNSSTPFSLLFVDIDNFKSVNDTHGHDFGDKVLKLIAKRLLRFKSRSSLLIRESSDEFIFLTQLTSDNEIKRLSERIIQVLAEPYEVDHSQFLLGCSIGVAKCPEHGCNLDSLLRAADIAMYKAKQQQNSFSIFTNQMQESHLYRMQVEQRLRIAIEKQTLFMVYQPLMNPNGTVQGVEALVRWIDSELGFVPPDVFIPIAESTGLMPKLGIFITESSIMQIAHLHRTTDHKLGLSLNISVRQFMYKDFTQHLLATLTKYKLSPEYLTLEITENLYIEDLGFVKPLCEKLNQHKIKISLDDFGTGYSSLSMLKALPIEELKIDKSFIDHIHTDTQSLTMVQNIIAIGKNFGMTVLAEGVETQEHAEILQASGCDLMQGYYFSRPVPYEDLNNTIVKLEQPSTIELSS